MKLEKKHITSYGLKSAYSYYYSPKSREDIIDVIHYAKQHNLKICPYGNGMSFSNVCLLDGQISLDCKKLNSILSFNKEDGIITAEAGIFTTDIIKLAMSFGWHLCGLSGSLKNTIAGDISNNVNGKDAFKYGHFGNNVLSMKIVTSDGDIITVSRDKYPEIFFSVIGGMGLIAIIIEVTLKLIRIPSIMITQERKQLRNLEELMIALENLDDKSVDFNYTWVDAYAKGNQFGRSFFETASFADVNDSLDIENFIQYMNHKDRIAKIPPKIFWKLFNTVENPITFNIANKIRYNFFDKINHKNIPFSSFQYPMVKYFPDWNLKYIPQGFHEIQPLFVAEKFTEAFTEILSICRKHNTIPNICSVKKHIDDDYYMSFGAKGYSFTISYALSRFSENELQRFTMDIINIILKYGGRLYLGKYPYLSEDICKAMYPRYDNFIDTMNNINKDRLFYSDAASYLFPIR